jgi:GNAT superfamily N-acetyltransferase
MGDWPPSQWRRVGEILRWRGPFLFFLLAVREFVRPVVYWYVFYIFETDVAQQPLPEPYAKDKLEAKVYSRERDVEKAKVAVVALGELHSGIIASRLDRGDAVAIAYASGEPVGYGWLSFSTHAVELAFGFNWIVRPREAVKYGNFVLPKWRGRGIQSFVNAAVSRYARDIGVIRTVSSISVLNTQSMSLVKHDQKASTMKVVLVHIPALNWTIKKTSGSSFESLFAKSE